MATIRKARNQYFARITWRLDGRKREVTIPLKTQSKKTADERKIIFHFVFSLMKDERSFVVAKSKLGRDRTNAHRSVPT